MAGQVSFLLMSPESPDFRAINSYLFPTLGAPEQVLGVPEEGLELSRLGGKP